MSTSRHARAAAIVSRTVRAAETGFYHPRDCHQGFTFVARWSVGADWCAGEDACGGPKYAKRRA